MIEPKIDMWRFKSELDELATQSAPHKTLFYGSSTFAFWKQVPQIFAKYDAVLCGFGGSTSHEALFHFDYVAKRQQPEVLVWYFGDNEPVCGYTARETERLFVATWQKFREVFPNIKVITVLTKTSPARDEYAAFVKELDAWQKQYAEQNRDWLQFVETADICRNEQGYITENYMPDMLHFGEKGYAILENRLKKALDKIYE